MKLMHFNHADDDGGIIVPIDRIIIIFETPDEPGTCSLKVDGISDIFPIKGTTARLIAEIEDRIRRE